MWGIALAKAARQGYMIEQKSTWPRWYAVHTRPQSEAEADCNLRRQGYWTFYPFHRIRRRRKRPNTNVYTVEWVERPYFSRYVFVALRHDQESLYGVNETDGVSTVVYCGPDPLVIPHSVMDELMDRADDKGLIGVLDNASRPKLKPGQMVTFKDNSPLAGLVAQVAVDAGREIRVWLDVLGGRRRISVTPSAVAEIAR